MKTIKKVGALIIKNGKLMIVKPSGKPFFINPGGKYEIGENAKNCLERELSEELGVKLKSSQHYRTYEIKKAAHSNNSLLLELHFVTFEGEPIPLSEISEIGWMSGDDFKNGKYDIAPSFYQYVPDLIRDELL